jgi:AmmeMemoRadiSam system protein A
MTSEADRQRLLRIARQAIVAHVTGLPQERVVSPPDEPMGGGFVTLHLKGNLRGCVGSLGRMERHSRVAADCAVAACSADPRFEPVGPAELDDLEIEISLLGPLDPVKEPGEIEIGRHGLVVEQGSRRGLLLPQVAPEHHWDPETFFAQTCRKAGLASDAWQHGARVFRFEAEVFAEPERRRE